MGSKWDPKNPTIKCSLIINETNDPLHAFETVNILTKTYFSI